MVPGLKDDLPLRTLGPYDPGSLSRPAIWLRGVLSELELQEGTPVIYLPGVGRADLRAVEDSPRELQPLAELQDRGVVFSHPIGRDWSPATLLGNTLGIEIAGGQKTQNARALPELLKHSVAELQEASGT